MKDEGGWAASIKDVLIGFTIAFLILVSLLGGMFLYAGMWPPLSVIESNSMQHSADTSYLGVIDTGDMVIVKSSDGTDVVTYVEGSISGYSMFGAYGDVIIYHPLGSDDVTPIIHRAIIWLEYNGSGGWNAPSLEDYTGSWAVSSGDGFMNMTGTLLLYDLGYAEVTAVIDLDSLEAHSGYVTMGDFNWRNVSGVLGNVGFVDQIEDGPSEYALVEAEWVESRAMIEIPWVGVIKLFANDNNIQMIPLNSIVSLGVAIFLILLTPILAEYGWERYQKRKGEAS